MTTDKPKLVRVATASCFDLRCQVTPDMDPLYELLAGKPRGVRARELMQLARLGAQAWLGKIPLAGGQHPAMRVAAPAPATRSAGEDASEDAGLEEHLDLMTALGNVTPPAEPMH